MTIFQSAKIIMRTMNDSYYRKRSAITQDRMEIEKMRREQKIRFALNKQLGELLVQLKKNPNIQSLTVDIRGEAEEYLQEVVSTLEMLAVPTGEEHEYLLILNEEEL